MAFYTAYLSTNRGVAKMLQVIRGFIICSLLCVNWYNGRSCLFEYRISFAASLSFFVVILNICIFFLNFLNLGMIKVERIYSIICSLLFLIAAFLLIWFVVQKETHRVYLIVAAVLILIESLLFLLDIKIIAGEISDE